MVLAKPASQVFFLKKSLFFFSPLTGKRKKTSKIFELNTVQNGGGGSLRISEGIHMAESALSRIKPFNNSLALLEKFDRDGALFLTMTQDYLDIILQKFALLLLKFL